MELLSKREREDRPWGSFERFTLNELSTVKLLRLNPGARLSLQTHEKRSEFWRVLSGSGTVTMNGAESPAAEGSEFEIPANTPHRIAAGESGLVWLEIALGEFDEDDEVRLEDDYQRSSPR